MQLRPSFSPAPLALAACLALGIALPAAAQSSASAPAQVSIGAQPLSQALTELARQTGITLVVSPDLVAGKTAPAVSGRLTARQALDRLLAGSGLAADIDGAAVTVRREAEAGSSALPAVTVTAAAEQESPWGPVNGFVARRSATATKTDTPILETSQSISVITREEMDAQQAQTVRATLRFAPGVSISDDADNRLDTITSRGFALDQYLDGLKTISGTWSVTKVEPYLLERVEVLKGPSSVLYGQASPGGVLNLVGKRASAETVRDVQLQYGSNSFKEGAFDIGGAVNDDKTLSARIVGLVRDSKTEVNDTKEQRIAIAPSLTWQPDARTKVTLMADYLRDPSGGFWNLLPYQGTISPNPYGRIDRSFYTGQPSFEHFARTQYSLGYAAERQVNDNLTVRQNLRYRHLEVDYRSVQGLGLQADNRTMNRQAYTANEDLDTLTVDTQAELRFRTGPVAHKVLAGIDYQHLDWDNLTRFGNAPTLDILAPDYNQYIPLPGIFQNAHQKQRQVGLYAQDEIAWDRLRLQIGGRKDWARTDTDNYVAKNTTRQRDDAFTGRVGLLYLFDNGVAPYVSYATSFQPQAGTGFDGSAFLPTKGKQTEVGVKYQPKNTDMLFTAAAYDLRQTNVGTPDPLHANFSVQTGEVRSRGVELSGVANLTEQLKLRASYSHLDNEITQSTTASTIGNRLAATPAEQASLWADYALRGEALKGLSVGGGVRRTGSFFTSNANTQLVPGATVFDAAIRYDFGVADASLRGLKLALNISNLFDRQYISVCSVIGCRYGLGRAAYVTLRYGW
jgi:iron complex outermembrane receptor protein